jgi:hypothetical protein
MEGIVKIGKTIRDPEGRVKELSSATGVPTPFILVYKELFSDCDQAEKLIHRLLEEKNFRLSKGREFFSIPVYEAINVIMEIKNNNHFSTNESLQENTINNYGYQYEQVAQDLVEEAESYYYGYDDTLQDYNKAFELFKRAANLNYSIAYYYLGKMYYYGEGCKQSLKEAISHYQKASSLGYVYSYVYLAQIYIDDSSPFYHEINKEKCLDKFFDYLDKRKILNYDDLQTIQAFLFMHGLYQARLYNIKESYLNVLSKFKSEILSHIDMILPYYTGTALSSWKEIYSLINRLNTNKIK